MEKDESHILNDNANLSSILSRLNLENKYPEKLTIEEVLAVGDNAIHLKIPQEESEIPHYILHKLFSLDTNARHFHISIKSEIRKDKDNIAVDSDLDSIFDEIEDSKTDVETHLHPSDVLLSIFLCSDIFLQQLLLKKLADCQLALPLLIPKPGSNNILFPLWSLRGIRKSWKTCELSKFPCGKDQSVVNIKSHFVTFLRIGEGLNLSKSQIINEIMTFGKHDIFFHRNCEGASSNRYLLDGVAEISWYLPEGKESDSFNQIVTFVNSHGNAIDNKIQIDVLSCLSSMIVVFTSKSYFTGDGRLLIAKLFDSEVPLLCLFTDIEKSSSERKKNKWTMGIHNTSTADRRKKIVTILSTCLDSSKPEQSLSEWNIPEEQGIRINEQDAKCQKAKCLAKMVTDALYSNVTLANDDAVKSSYLPLQGPPWYEWCKTDKELCRMLELSSQPDKCSIEQYKSRLREKQKKIRTEQKKRAFPLNIAIKAFYDSCKTCGDDGTISKYFFEWLKDMLEEQALTTASSLISLEHILRECTQIYESVEATESFMNENDMTEVALYLPSFAAVMLISGHSLELMDGDASHVPIQWIRAVLTSVGDKLNDSRIFVVSVLGIQSTGKSTMLNAMFGLQFVVGAGRCTRGAFMQLIKVEDALRGELRYDYIIVVDTEGLKAPEMICSDTQRHDNELATFVIGIGDVTLINIFGENPADMQDILQITVQSLLRMKQIRLEPSCHFVHQNVTGVDAKSDTLTGRKTLLDRLDEMTKLAAEIEKRPEIYFSDVVQFDLEKQAWYFSSLWQGNPPMAPPNPGYSSDILDLKQSILCIPKKKKVPTATLR